MRAEHSRDTLSSPISRDHLRNHEKGSEVFMCKQASS